MIHMSTHLSVRSSFSLLDSTIRIPSLVKTARALGFSSIALSDRNVMYGCPAFSDACRKEGIRPVFGMEADCMYHEEVVPFLLLAKDNIGYRNLVKLSSLINSGRGYCTALELGEYASHCFLIVYGEGGWFDSELIADDRDAVTEKLKIMKAELPEFDVALSYQDASLWKNRNGMLKRVCSSLGIRTAALNRVYYLRSEDAEAYRIMCGIRLQKTLRDPSLPYISGRYLLSEEEMSRLYEPDDLARTDEISSQCVADGTAGETGLPSFPVPGNLTSAQYLTQLCLAGLRKRLNGDLPAGYLKRLKYELDTITEMHFEDYFLIVYDFIRFARLQGIYVGPGRGSAAGSLVAYVLGITQVDPIRYGLLFERFLNPERVSMPDIDTDFPDNRRQEVIDYVYRKYGRDHTANIVTFGTLKARQALRDVGRVLEIPVRDIDMLCRMIPVTENVRYSLSDALNSSPRLKQMVNSDDRYRRLFDIAVRLEDLPRHASVHPAGIVMSSVPLEEVVPTMSDGEGMKTVQYSMEYLEERGLIKMDFLGLRNLTIIDKIVQQIHVRNPEFRIMDIPLDDKEVYQAFAACDTTGIFQFESSGMRNLLRRMKPECFEDIVAALALYRPGPKENIPLYLENKAHPEKIVYPAEELVPILEDTYGIMIYQEQIMQTARTAAGFSLARADVLRKAISKKNLGEMEKMKEAFVNGCLEHGYSRDKAEELFSWIEKFAGYGFNRSHAVAYAVVACQLMWLKVREPLYFYSALLDASISDETRTAGYLAECRRRGIPVKAPDICRSGDVCVIFEGMVFLPLSCIKGVGMIAAKEIMAERGERQFSDYFDCIARLTARKITGTAVENLIDAGAMDCFGMNRTTMKHALPEALRYADLVRIDRSGMTLIDTSLVSRPVIMNYADQEMEVIENEKKALGFYFSSHPAGRIRETLGQPVPTIAALTRLKGQQTGFGMIRRVFEHRTKRGEMMAFLSVADETGEMSVTVMPNLYRQYGNELRKGKYILFHGKMEKKDSCLADRLEIIKNGSLNYGKNTDR